MSHDVAKPVSTRSAERIIAGEMLAELRAIRERTTAFAGLLQGNIVNEVLTVETFTFGADGYVTRQWHAAAGAVEVSNHGLQPITVYAGSPVGDAVPGDGPGIYVVNTLDTRTVALASRAVTFYGTEGERVSYQAFTAAVRPVT